MSSHFKLLPSNEVAKQLCEDLPLPLPAADGAPHVVTLGRSGTSTLPIVPSWVQFSTTHLRIWGETRLDGRVEFKVQDTSTNGTWLNDVRLKKGDVQTLQEGSTIQLSTAPTYG